MTMSAGPKQVPAARFKAECLALLDRVANTGEPLVVTKRGRAVAKVVPIERTTTSSLRGSVTFHGDIVGPLDDRWDADS